MKIPLEVTVASVILKRANLTRCERGARHERGAYAVADSRSAMEPAVSEAPLSRSMLPTEVRAPDTVRERPVVRTTKQFPMLMLCTAAFTSMVTV